MEILYLLVPLSVVFVFLIGVIFWWSLKSGQFEDLEGPAYRILRDDDDLPAQPPVESAKTVAEPVKSPRFDADQG